MNTVKDALTMVTRREKIFFEGKIGKLEVHPMFLTSGLSDSNEMICRDSNMYLVDMMDDNPKFHIPCILHNMILEGDSSDLLPCGKSEAEFEILAKVLQNAYESYTKVTLSGVFGNVVVGKNMNRELYFFINDYVFDDKKL